MGFKSRFECDDIFNISDGGWTELRGSGAEPPEEQRPQEERWVEGKVRRTNDEEPGQLWGRSGGGGR